jgi:hypothetical protein
LNIGNTIVKSRKGSSDLTGKVIAHDERACVVQFPNRISGQMDLEVIQLTELLWDGNRRAFIWEK